MPEALSEFAKIEAEERKDAQRNHKPTFRALAEDWTSGELARRHPDHVKVKKTAHDDELRLEKHVYPHVGDIEIDALTLDDAERVM